MLFVRRCRFAAWLLLAVVAVPCAQAGGFQMRISFPGYTNRTEVLTNFPVLVVLSNNVAGSGLDYSTFASANGWDLRFRDAADTVNLNYEIESWNSSGASFVWVQVPALAGDGTGSILAKWGDSGDSAQLACTTNGATWAPEFRGVWHLQTPTAPDSTTNGNTGVANNNTNATGLAGTAQAFNGSTAFIDCGNKASIQLTSKLTLSCWVAPDNLAGERGLASKWSGSWCWALNRDGNTVPGRQSLYFNGWNSANSVVGLNTWSLLTAAYDSTAQMMYFYLNGQPDGSGSQTTPPGTGANLNIGRRENDFNTGSPFSGLMDEVRLEAVTRSSNWVWACYMTMASNTAFHSYGIAQSAVPGAPMIADVGASAITASSGDLVGKLMTGNVPATVTCYWGTNDGGRNPSAWTSSNSWSASTFGYLTNSIASGMLPATRYYFRYYVTNNAGDFWALGSIIFSTLGAPSVDNAAGATAVGQTSATLNGTLVAGNPSPAVWIYWGTTNGGTSKGAWNRTPISIGQPGLAPFSAGVSGLLANQQYWYRSYASNSYNDAWSSASTNFTTVGPGITIGDIGLLEGAQGSTTTAVFTVTLSATSAVSVSVGWGTSNGTALVSDNDYQPASGTLTIPAGAATGGIPVTIIGDSKFEPNEVFYVNLSNAVNATVSRTPGSCTITNDDWTFYVRGDGLGSDANDGSSWSTAFATLQQALSAIPKPGNTTRMHPVAGGTPLNQIRVQASSGSQTYAGATYSTGYGDPGVYVDVAFDGGWQNVASSPVQTGISVVTNAAGAGLHIDQDTAHSAWKRVAVNRFLFTNVLQGVELVQGSGADGADILLTVSNTTVYAQSNGLFVSYPKGYPASYGLVRLTAVNTQVKAGLGGSGYGIYVSGQWAGSSVAGAGSDPVTGTPYVSAVSSAGGTGVCFQANNSGNTCDSQFSNLVVYGCTGVGIRLDAAGGVVQAKLNHCTIADNGGDGVWITSVTAGSWATVSNSIFANNGGHGIGLAMNGSPAFTCVENYNVFFNDDVCTNGAAQTLANNSLTSDPLFFGQRAQPSPWYLIGSPASSAYRRIHPAGDGGNRGAYQNNKIPWGVLFIR